MKKKVNKVTPKKNVTKKANEVVSIFIYVVTNGWQVTVEYRGLKSKEYSFVSLSDMVYFVSKTLKS